MIEPVQFLDFIEKLKKGLYDVEISKEILVRDWGPDDPLDKALVYIAGNKVAVVPLPIDPTKDKISSYYIVEDVPCEKGGPDYRSAYQQFMKKTGHGDVGRGIIAPKGERNSLIALYSGLAFHESPFNDSP